MEIAIIGSGISGSTILSSLIKSEIFNSNNDRIHVFDERTTPGRGMPYQNDHISLKMNSAARYLSVNPEDVDEFTRFLENRYPDWDDGEGLISRQFYGDYLEETFSPYYNHALVYKHDYNIVDMKVIDNINKALPHAYLLKNNQQWLNTQFDAVFLAIGHAPYGDYYQLASHDKFIQMPYPVNEKLAELTNKDRIGIIGSGASGLDIMRYLDDVMALDYPMTFYVRGEPFSSTGVNLHDEDIDVTIDKEWIKDQKAKYNGFIPLRVIKKQVNEDFKAYGIDWNYQVREYGSGHFSENIRAHETQPKANAYVINYFDQLTPVKADLYQSLSETDSLTFMKEDASYFDLFRSPVPSGTMERIKQLLIRNELRIVSNLTDITTDTDGKFLIYTNGKERETTDVLINATGFDRRLAYGDDLIKNLYDKKIIMPKTNGKDISITWPHGQIINRIQGVLPNAFALGNYIYSTQYPNNNAQSIIQQAQRTADYFIKEMKGLNK